MVIPIIIDTDPGIDDAAAISLALSHPNIEVKMISTVNGNVNVDKTTNNALKLVHFSIVKSQFIKVQLVL